MAKFEAMKAGYRNLWDAASLRRVKVADRVAEAILATRERYAAVEAVTGVPWFFIAAIHQRESGRRWDAVLHNGERIIGTGRKTRLVPKRRGPFATWEGAAVASLKYMRLARIEDWPLERVLYEMERWNGPGYQNVGINSPYLWAGTSKQQRGKFVRDGKFSATTWDKQLGTVAILKALEKRSPEITNRLAGRVFRQPDDPGTPPPASAAPRPCQGLFALFTRLFTAILEKMK